MAGPEHRVVFTPSGLTGRVADDTTVLAAARELGVDLDSVCGGRGLCGRCQVVPSTGEFAKWALTATPDHLSDWGPLEQAYTGRRPVAPGARLGCGARILGDVVIDVPPESQIHKQVVRKAVDVGHFEIDPLYTLHYVDRDGPEDVLAGAWDLHDVDLGGVDLPGPGGLPYTLALRDRQRAVAVWPGFVDVAVGVAVDIGSTTIAGHLCDLTTGEILASAGRMNPQIRYGEDLMSRVSYVMMNPGGDAELTRAVRGALDSLIGELLADAGLEADRVLDVVLVGNPIMHHLALGIDPTPLGQAPFTLATDGAVELAAAELDLGLALASAYAGPCIAGHVGADAAAAILAEGPHRGREVQLLVDVGTNAEIVLGNADALYAASSPTGPAFEGAQISCGQRATAGAIERVRIDPDTLEPRFKVIGAEAWSDEPGFAEQTAATGITGVCGSGIIEVISELVRAGVIDRQGIVVGATAERSPRVVADGRTFAYVLHDSMRITQADVRAIQLAKAALRAGTELLWEHAGRPDIDSIRLAGAFGAHIDPEHAIRLGLIPEVALDKVRAVGNAAGAGAVRALLSGAQRREMERTVESVIKIETATEPRFQELFVAALGFHAAAASAPPARRRRRKEHA